MQHFRHNAGAALAISLVFLLVLGLLGLAATRMSIMQERMAGNVRESNQAFQAAESTLREIETRVRALVEQGSTGGLGVVPLWTDLSLDQNDCTLQIKADSDWSGWDDAPWRTAPETGNDYLILAMPAVVDTGSGYIQPPCIPSEESSETATDEFYLVVARAFGPAGTGEAIVQSIFYWPE